MSGPGTSCTALTRLPWKMDGEVHFVRDEDGAVTYKEVLSKPERPGRLGAWLKNW